MSPDDIALENVIKQIEFSVSFQLHCVLSLVRCNYPAAPNTPLNSTFIRKTFSSFQPSEGPFVLGYAMCFGLMGVLSVQCFDALPRRLVIYFTKFPNDRTWIRVLGKLASPSESVTPLMFEVHSRSLSRGAFGRERDTCTWAITRSAVTITLITASSDADGVGVISCAAGLGHSSHPGMPCRLFERQPLEGPGVDAYDALLVMFLLRHHSWEIFNGIDREPPGSPENVTDQCAQTELLAYLQTTFTLQPKVSYTSANRIGNSQTVTSCGVVKQQRSMFAGSDKLVSPLFVLLNCGREAGLGIRTFLHSPGSSPYPTPISCHVLPYWIQDERRVDGPQVCLLSIPSSRTPADGDNININPSVWLVL
ncbi:hypothetical protein L210DRAFT_3506340 [Boletus edulis BED1]|uniref:Uncharacterized protein n=1 Tax=Boletus edulis BED1 TaxID=1328754 RepID=A0AAD4BNE1_BOLED|nr:hypothetical protein L210DRAFT_3506340 [Boletus edulis BED1]